MPKFIQSRIRLIGIALLVLALLAVLRVGLWWREREWEKSLADGSSTGAGNETVNSKATVPDLIAKLSSASSTERILATESLGRIGEPAVHDLIPVLKADDASVRRYAALALARMGPQAAAAVPALGDALNDEDLAVIQNALSALQQVGPAADGAIGAIQGTLQHPDRSVRVSAVDSLGAIGQAAVPALLEVIHDENQNVRVFAAIALWKVAHDVESVLPTLCDSIKDRKPSLSVQDVAQVLGEIGPAAKPAFTDLLEMQKSMTQQNDKSGALPAIIQALKKIDPDAAAKAEVP